MQISPDRVALRNCAVDAGQNHQALLTTTRSLQACSKRGRVKKITSASAAAESRSKRPGSPDSMCVDAPSRHARKGMAYRSGFDSRTYAVFAGFRNS
jgi:hypothetical protein